MSDYVSVYRIHILMNIHSYSVFIITHTIAHSYICMNTYNLLHVHHIYIYLSTLYTLCSCFTNTNFHLFLLLLFLQHCKLSEFDDNSFNFIHRLCYRLVWTMLWIWCRAGGEEGVKGELGCVLCVFTRQIIWYDNILKNIPWKWRERTRTWEVRTHL